MIRVTIKSGSKVFIDNDVTLYDWVDYLLTAVDSEHIQHMLLLGFYQVMTKQTPDFYFRYGKHLIEWVKSEAVYSNAD